MERGDDGWWRARRAGRRPRHRLRVPADDHDSPLPDPRSAWQPEGVHGPSRVYDHSAFAWSDGAWTGRQLPGSVLYELHVGTFTPEGTFDAAIERLDHLVDLGVDLVELLPVNAFNGEYNWGYDGVCWFAPHEAYGGPDGLKRFVDAAHARGLGVVLDVVYNHFGPSGAYAPMFAPYLSAAGTNPWGASVNLDGPQSEEVRRYIIDSVLTWLRDYHVDGLRLDAVHALVDHNAVHLLEQLAVEVESLSTHLRPAAVADRRVRPQRPEADHPPRGRRVRPAGASGTTTSTTRCTPCSPANGRATTRDFGSLECLEAVLTGAFFHAGTWSSFRRRRHGRPGRPDPYSRAPVRGVPAEPRPDRQPGRRRPALGDAVAGDAAGRRDPAAHLPVHPDAVHGRGVGGQHAVAVLHQPPRAGAGRGRADRPAPRVRLARLGRGRGARPAGPGHVRPVQARLGRARQTGPRRAARSATAG